MKTHLCILFALLLVFTSCETKKEEPFVDTMTNIYHQLDLQTNDEVKTLVRSVESIEMFQEFKKPLKILRIDDEMKVLSALLEVSIENDSTVNSLDITNQNTLFIHNNNNVSYGSFSENEESLIKKGYYITYGTATYSSDSAKELWERNMVNFENPNENDSVTMSDKVYLEKEYHQGVSKLKELKYIVLIHDVLCIPPKLDRKNGGFISGYIVTNAYTYDVKTLEKIGQNMLISSNKDQIAYIRSEASKFDDTWADGRLRADLIDQKKKAIDATFGLGEIVGTYGESL